MGLIFGNQGNLLNENDGLDNDDISLESAAAILEAVLLETMTPEELDELLESSTDINAAIGEEILMEKTIVRLDKAARLSHAEKMAVFSLAKENNDPLFKKLLTVWRMERYLENALHKKYSSKARRVAITTVNKASKSRSNQISKAANTAKKQMGAGAGGGKKRQTRPSRAPMPVMPTGMGNIR